MTPLYVSVASSYCLQLQQQVPLEDLRLGRQRRVRRHQSRMSVAFLARSNSPFFT